MLLYLYSPINLGEFIKSYYAYRKNKSNTVNKMKV